MLGIGSSSIEVVGLYCNLILLFNGVLTTQIQLKTGINLTAAMPGARKGHFHNASSSHRSKQETSGSDFSSAGQTSSEERKGRSLQESAIHDHPQARG